MSIFQGQNLCFYQYAITLFLDPLMYLLYSFWIFEGLDFTTLVNSAINCLFFVTNTNNMLTLVMLVIRPSHINLSFQSAAHHAKLSKVKSLPKAESRLSRTLYYYLFPMDRDQCLSCDTRLCQCDD